MSHGSNLVNSSYAHAKVSRGDLRSKSILGVYLREDKTVAGTSNSIKPCLKPSISGSLFTKRDIFSRPLPGHLALTGVKGLIRTFNQINHK